MKILTCTRPGHLEYGVADMPQLLPGNALVKIKRIGICGTDLHAFEGTQPYFSYPRVLGHELACELIDTGGAEGFKKAKPLRLSPTTTVAIVLPAVRQRQTAAPAYRFAVYIPMAAWLNICRYPRACW
jgi:threonine dehydrogenase-like Zn-dependent dehydrogenase